MTSASYPTDPEGFTAGPVGGENGGSSGAKEQAKQAAGTAAEETKHVAGVAHGEAHKVASEATSQVRGLVSQATSQVEEQSRTQLGRLAETLQSYGEDLEKMAAQSDGPASGLAREAAERTRGLATHLQSREPRDLVEDVRRFARRRPGTFLLGALAAGVVAGRLTRGAKAAHDEASSDNDLAYPGAYATRGPFGGSPYDSPRVADVSSPGQPTSAAYAVPSSGPVLDTSTQVHGTASGEPLAGTGSPVSEPVYPGGAEDGRA
jgi:gas vesicle protein